MRGVLLFAATAIAVGGLILGCSLYGGSDDPEPLPDRADETPPPPPSPPDIDTGTDAGVPEASTTCDAHAPFTSITAVDAVNTPTDENNVHLTTDELTMYVARAGAIAVYTRASIAGPLTGGAGLPHAADNFDVPRVTDDTLRIYWSVFLGGGLNASRVVLSSRATTSADYSNGIYVDLGAPDGKGDYAPYFLPDERTLYFTTNRGDAGVEEVFVARKGSGTSFQSPTSVTSLYSAAGDKHAVAIADESVIYFSSHRSPTPDGTWQIYVGYKNTTGYDVAPVTEISPSPVADPSWISADLCRLYFMSDRAGGKGARDVWVASRNPI